MKDSFLFFKDRNWSDPENFGRVYDEYVKGIYRFIYLKVGSAVDAQDLTSQTFLKAWQYLSDDSRDVRNIKAFLYRVARNSVVDHFRSQGSEGQWLENFEAAETQPSTVSVEEDINKSISHEAVMAAMDKLNPAYREVVLMRYVEDLDMEEISQVLNKSNGAVRVLIHRAVQDLKNILDEKR